MDGSGKWGKERFAHRISKRSLRYNYKFVKFLLWKSDSVENWGDKKHLKYVDKLLGGAQLGGSFVSLFPLTIDISFSRGYMCS